MTKKSTRKKQSGGIGCGTCKSKLLYGGKSKKRMQKSKRLKKIKKRGGKSNKHHYKQKGGWWWKKSSANTLPDSTMGQTQKKAWWSKPKSWFGTRRTQAQTSTNPLDAAAKHHCRSKPELTTVEQINQCMNDYKKNPQPIS